MTGSDLSETVVVSTVVSIEPDQAFRIFTEDIDMWWKRGERYRVRGDTALRFEPGPGGRLVADEQAGGTREIGKVVAWEPEAGRLVFEFRAANFEPGETTEVEVLFEAVESGTRVTLQHRGLDALRPDHPARHGMEGPALVALYGTWWAEMLVALRRCAKPGGADGAGNGEQVR